MTSANPHDVREGYCGHCHAFTGFRFALCPECVTVKRVITDEPLTRENPCADCWDARHRPVLHLLVRDTDGSLPAAPLCGAWARHGWLNLAGTPREQTLTPCPVCWEAIVTGCAVDGVAAAVIARP